MDPNIAIGHMLDLSVFLFESFLQFKVGLSFLFDALLLHISLDAGVHRNSLGFLGPMDKVDDACRDKCSSRQGYF